MFIMLSGCPSVCPHFLVSTTTQLGSVQHFFEWDPGPTDVLLIFLVNKSKVIRSTSVYRSKYDGYVAE